MRGHRRGEDGFTLVEVSIILIVAAILSAVIAPVVSGNIERARG